ncbi:diacylglycerol kinase family protein [Bacillaceae bacterium W0354]
MEKKDRVGFKYAIAGFYTALVKERNMKVHVIFMFIVMFTGLFLKISVIEWLFILLAIAFVLSSELINTAIELIVDELFPTIHERAKIIKDISAASVLISSIFAAIVGIIIFLPKLILLF